MHTLIEAVADKRAGEWFKVSISEVRYLFDTYYEGIKNGHQKTG